MYYSALLGKPTDHSISPQLFRIIGEQFKIEYAHIKIDVNSKNLLPDYLNALKLLGFCGVNITLPYKIDVMDFIDEFDESATKCGAVNTISFHDGRSKGYNTDTFGAIQAIEQKLRKIREGDKVCVIGAGGAARAVICEVYRHTKNISIVNINFAEAIKVSEEMSDGMMKVFELNNKNLYEQIEQSDFIVNTTPVGMSPKPNCSIVNQLMMSKFKTLEGKCFFDAIFNPYKTKFLIDAETKGAKVCSGIYWMIFQATAALRVWIDKDYTTKVDPDKIANSLRKYLNS